MHCPFLNGGAFNLSSQNLGLCLNRKKSYGLGTELWFRFETSDGRKEERVPKLAEMVELGTDLEFWCSLAVGRKAKVLPKSDESVDLRHRNRKFAACGRSSSRVEKGFESGKSA